MENLIQQILNQLDKLDAGQQQLQSEVVGLKFDQLQLQSDVAELRSDQLQLQNGVAELKSGQLQLQNDVTELKSGQRKLEADITGIKVDIASIQKETLLIPLVNQAVSVVSEEVLAFNGTVKQVQATMSEHEITLGTLSRRSIDQEAKLKHSV